MKTAVVKKTNTSLVIEERPVLEPKVGEVLIKVNACGVCHSDLEVRLGHEVAGVVNKVGPGVTWPKVGESRCHHVLSANTTQHHPAASL